ncbi:tetratricopeptide repeat protein [Streptomyces albidoflavus]|uniref:tetratricopeptide repeat protein n=1 Tax=Streptomyces albidoflavus TaxID=1886 RepID=UPI0004C5B955|nr:tetratricopeptide repeat protein [Streptomyces albidoflavus]
MTDQVVGTSGPQAPGASPSSGPPRPAFFGRGRELKELRAEIDRAGLDTIAGRGAPRPRFLLIAGAPGSGRTALAGHLAASLADRYPDGVLSARLTAVDGTALTEGEAARLLLDGLGARTVPGASDDDLTHALRQELAGRRLLVLLDDAASAEQVDPLMPEGEGAAHLLFVAVSRGPLTGLTGVRPCALGGLDVPDAHALLESRAGEVRLTVDPRAADSLIERCGAQPAALVLAGGYLAAHPKISVADLAHRLEQAPADGPGGPGELPRMARLSHGALPAAAARTLRLLAFAPAGQVDAHTASALAGASLPAVRTILGELADLGFLSREPDPEPGEEPRWTVPSCLQPVLRDLADDHERPAELQLARARMLERTVRLLHSCRAVTDPESSPARVALAALPRALRFDTAEAAAAWLERSRGALLASARLAVADGELDTLARRLLAAIVRAMIAHRGAVGAAPDLYPVHGLVLDVAERRRLPREKAAALLNLADLDASTGRTRQALARYRAALDAARAAHDAVAAGRAMESVAGSYQSLEEWPRAADWYGRALTERLARDEHADAARVYGRLGTVHTYAGRYGEALRQWRAAVAAYRRCGDVAGRARALSEQARVQEYAGRPQESLRTCQEAVQWAREAGDDRLLAALRLRLADTLERLGDPAAARLHRAAAEQLLAPAGPGEGGAAPEDGQATAPAGPLVPGEPVVPGEPGVADAVREPVGAQEAPEVPEAPGERAAQGAGAVHLRNP